MSKFFALSAAALVFSGGTAFAQIVEPSDLGVVEAPAAGKILVGLNRVPLEIIHSAEVAVKQFDARATLTGAQVDKDEVLAVWEIFGTTTDGRAIEVDVRPDGVVLELEVQVFEAEVPAAVSGFLQSFFPTFIPEASGLIEKSIRPSEIGLPEIWYEYSGQNFDVEVRSDARAGLLEPA